MSNAENDSADADLKAVLDRVLTGKPLDPDAYRRVRERGERLIEEIRQKHGVVDIAADLVQEARDGA
jgi:hypothetical protein